MTLLERWNDLRDIADYFGSFLPTLLGPVLTRSHMMQLKELPSSRQFRVNVYRSFPFEYSSKTLNLFASIWGARFEFTYTDYDPALSQLKSLSPGDIDFFWIDWRIPSKNWSPKDSVAWWLERVAVSRQEGCRPLLVNNWPAIGDLADSSHPSSTKQRKWVEELNFFLDEKVSRLPDACVINLNILQSRLGEFFFDPRNDKISGYPFSDQAALIISRYLGCQLLPELLNWRLKALIVDFDQTLYSGILIDDGVDQLVLTDSHKNFQTTLLSLKNSGLLLCACSRNNPSDVEKMFKKRTDFPLRPGDFAATIFNWEPKSKNILGIAEILNIHPSSMLFIDDNPAELAEVSYAIPDLKLLLAHSDASKTQTYLENYPGLYRKRLDASESDRTMDIQANTLRRDLQRHSGSEAEYLSGLKMVLHYYRNYQPHAVRLHEMSQKFNQFNLSLKRLGEAEARQALGPGFSTMTFRLSDIFTDSGIVGALVCRIQDREATVENILWSCRVLGRQVEDLAFRVLLQDLKKSKIETLNIIFQEGPRNLPAFKWITRYAPAPFHCLPLEELLQKAETWTQNYPAICQEAS